MTRPRDKYPIRAMGTAYVVQSVMFALLLNRAALFSLLSIFNDGARKLRFAPSTRLKRRVGKSVEIVRENRLGNRCDLPDLPDNLRSRAHQIDTDEHMRSDTDLQEILHRRIDHHERPLYQMDDAVAHRDVRLHYFCQYHSGRVVRVAHHRVRFHVD